MIKIAFHPTGTYRLLGIDMKQTVNSGLDATSFWGEDVFSILTRLRQSTSYDAMVEMSGNGELARTMPLARTDLFRAQLETVQNEKQRSRHASGYSKIAQAIADCDPAAADRAVKRHFDGTRTTIEELPISAFATLEDT